VERWCRMLADTQQSSQRESSLVMAAPCFASTALAFERAEALLCLAQHMVRGLRSHLHCVLHLQLVVQTLSSPPRLVCHLLLPDPS